MSDDPNFLGLFRNERKIVTLQSGDILFKEGDPATSMYIVRSGSVRIARGNRVFEDVEAGGIVGEMAIIDHAPRSATVSALIECELVEVDESRFLFLIQQTPRFAISVMRVLSRRLRRMDDGLRV